MDAAEYNAWASRFLWPFNLVDDCPVKAFDPGSAACEAWVREFQESHGLAVDGRLGPSMIHACAAVFDDEAGGVGGLMIGGQEIDLGIPVARMPTMKRLDARLETPPTLGVFIAGGEFERHGRDRRANKRPIRSHIAIDAARGRDGHALVIQWADPHAVVPFVPVDEPGDYPPGRQVLGVEIENPLTPHRREAEQRLWLRARELVTVFIAGRNVRQLALYPEQINTLEVLLDALTAHTDIPRTFPTRGEQFDLEVSDRDAWREHHGWIGQFNYKDQLVSPGVGFTLALPRLFPEVAASLSNPDPSAPETQLAGSGARSFGPATPAISDLARQAAAIDAAAAPVDVAANEEAREEVWSVEAASPVQPKVTTTRPFSLQGSLRRRGRSRSSRSRAEALRARFTDEEDDPQG